MGVVVQYLRRLVAVEHSLGIAVLENEASQFKSQVVLKGKYPSDTL